MPAMLQRALPKLGPPRRPKRLAEQQRSRQRAVPNARQKMQLQGVVQRKALTLEKWQAAVQRQVGICAQHSTALGFGEGCTTWAPWCAGGVADADCSGVCYHMGGQLFVHWGGGGGVVTSRHCGQCVAMHCTLLLLYTQDTLHKVFTLCIHTCWVQLTTD